MPIPSDSRLGEHRLTQRDVGDRQAPVPEEDRLVVALAAGPVAAQDLAELGVQVSAVSRPESTCARSEPSGPIPAWPQSSTTTLSMTSVSSSSTALTVP